MGLTKWSGWGDKDIPATQHIKSRDLGFLFEVAIFGFSRPLQTNSSLIVEVKSQLVGKIATQADMTTGAW